MKKLLVLAFCSVLLVACGEDVKTVEFYKENPSELDETLKKCNEMSEAEFMASTNCARAQEAYRTLPAKNMTFPN